MKTRRQIEAEQNLIGIDAAPKIRQAAKEMWEGAIERAKRADVDDQQYRYAEKAEICVMSFENPNGSWRMETLKDVCHGSGIVTVHEQTENFLMAEMKSRICNELVRRRIASNRSEALSKFTVRNMGRVPLLDSGRQKA